MIARLRRALARLTESDEERLAEEIRAWAATVPEAIPMSEAPLRTPVTLAGVVRRMTVLPLEGHESLEVLLADGTGEVRVVLMGRRSVSGLRLGTRLVVRGVVAEERGTRKMVNPRFEFAP